MSGLEQYYNSVSRYGSSNNAVDNFINSYKQAPLEEFNSRVEALKAQGSALVEAGGSVEGLYAGVKGLAASVKTLRAKASGSADDADDAPADDAPADDAPADGSVADTSGVEAEAEAEPIAQEGIELAPISESVVPAAAETISTALPTAVTDTASTLASTAAGVSGDTIASTAASTAAGAIAGTEGAEAGIGLLAGAAVAAEAIPVVGGIAAIGVGLYELFHHHSTPKPPTVPKALIAQKGESIIPSFDSVTDTPASSSAF